ncbi:hypothetical protein TNCV_964241 [Trichonephila clavipes]|nr:hypothetical protein TNCV_964241 [Trichonephila clavipes]
MSTCGREFHIAGVRSKSSTSEAAGRGSRDQRADSSRNWKTNVAGYTEQHISNLIMARRVIRYQTDKLAERVGSTKTTRNPIGMLGCKCRSCKIWSKEAEKKNRNNNTVKGQKIFCRKVVLQQVLEILVSQI